MLLALVYTFTFMALVTSVVAKEVDMSWVQEILKTKEANKEKNRQMAYEMIQDASENGNKGKAELATNPNQKICRSSVANLEDKASGNRYPQLLVFVSFSMPMEALKSLGQQVNKAGGKLVFRGLAGGSFPATSKKMQELGVDALIDPTLFESYQIKVCPVFVLSDKPLQTVEEKPSYDQLSGHVSLHHALDTLSRHGNLHATSLLQDLKGVSK